MLAPRISRFIITLLLHFDDRATMCRARSTKGLLCEKKWVTETQLLRAPVRRARGRARGGTVPLGQVVCRAGRAFLNCARLTLTANRLLGLQTLTPERT